VIQGLDSQQLRIHDISTGRLKYEHSLDGARISCLDWGYYGATGGEERAPAKKRRKNSAGDVEAEADAADGVVAIGTSGDNIQLFSPGKSRVVAILSGSHAEGVRDFKFVDYGLLHKAWSLGGDGKLVEWNLQDSTAMRWVRHLNCHTIVATDEMLLLILL